MIGMYSAVANANHMPLAGGAEPLLGTNPLAIAIPAGEEPPLVLDIATSIVSYGTIKNHRLQNIPLHDDWMVDPKTGEADHRSAQERRGAAAADGRLQGRGAGADVRPARRHAQRRAVRPRLRRFQRRARPASPTPASSSSALDPSRFQKLEQFKAEVDRHVRALRNSKALPGQSVRLPGDQRAKRRADRWRMGLRCRPELMKQLDALAGEMGVKRLGGALMARRARPHSASFPAVPGHPG